MKRTVFMAAMLVIVQASAPASARAQTELEDRHFRTSDGVRLHYLEAGSGPPLVFVPGWTMPAWIWERQLEHFASTHRVIALDPRGQGESEKPTHGYNAERRARDVCELLDHLDDEPAVVVGWSLGMQEVLVCAAEFGTENIRALVLVDHPVEFDASNFVSRFEVLQVDREAWTREFVEAIHRSAQPQEYLDALTEAALSTPTNAAAIMIANLILTGPTDLRPVLESVDRPALFVASSLDWAVATAEEVRERWPGLRVEVIDKTSHALFVDQPEAFNRVLWQFLESLPVES